MLMIAPCLKNTLKKEADETSESMYSDKIIYVHVKSDEAEEEDQDEDEPVEDEEKREAGKATI